MALGATFGLLLFQTVWVVDDYPGPGVDFPDIPPAIAAAADGDVLLVAPGTYSHFVLAGKGLRILGSGDEFTFVSLAGPAGYTTQISDVPSSQAVYLQGMNFGAPVGGGLNPADRVVVTGATTQVLLSDSIVVGWGDGAGFPLALNAAVRIEDAAVQIRRSTLASLNLLGGILDSYFNGGIALKVIGSARVHVTLTSVLGGKGRDTPVYPPPPGGPAIVVSEGTGGIPWLWVAASLVKGGRGGQDTGFPSGSSGAGAAGIVVSNAHVRVSGDAISEVVGGFGSPSAPAIVASGSYPVEVHSIPVQAGSPLVPATTGPVVLDAPPLPILRVPGNPAISAGSATVILSNGPPASLFGLVVSDRPSHFGIPGPFLGEFLLEPPGTLFAFDVLSPSGDFTQTIPLAGLPPSLAYAPFHLQAGTLDPGGTWRLTNSVFGVVLP